MFQPTQHLCVLGSWLMFKISIANSVEIHLLSLDKIQQKIAMIQARRENMNRQTDRIVILKFGPLAVWEQTNVFFSNFCLMITSSKSRCKLCLKRLNIGPCFISNEISKCKLISIKSYIISDYLVSKIGARPAIDASSFT